jgi:multidrug resistance efflux pump
MWMKTLCPRAQKKISNFLVFLALIFFLAGPAWLPEALGQPAATPSQAGSGDIILSGKLACPLKRHVIMPFLGVITALPVQAGQKVNQGETLARYRLLPESIVKIRSRIFPSEIKNLEMTQIKLAAKLSELEKQRAGLQELAKDNLTSQQSLDQVNREINTTCQEKTATAERLGWARQLHQDDLALLQKQLGSSGGVKHIPAEGSLSSPLNGYVVWLNADMRVGAEFRPEEPAFIVGDLDTMVIKAQVHELEAVRLRLGDPAEVRVVSLPGQKFTAQVTRISWSSITTAPDQPSFFEVEFSVPNPDHILKDGLKVQLTVPKAPTS